ncbi:MAG TPA: hypothetical protein VFW90_02560 [Candidatus Saccharimonadales bacterium]|nr:hypothetical protein [Candidatus Saccharimonadales bacterium]
MQDQPTPQPPVNPIPPPPADPPTTAQPSPNGPAVPPAAGDGVSTVAPPTSVISSAPAVSQPSIIVGSNPEAQPEKVKPKHHYWLVGIILAVLAILIVGAVFYFSILPNRWAKSYISEIKPLYDKQSAQMTAAYNSLSLPIFTSNKESESTDKADIAKLKEIVQSAVSANNALKAKNKLKTLPGTGWMSSVLKASDEKRNMDGYLADSQKFLDDYSGLVTYADKLYQIENGSLTAVGKDIDNLSAGSSSVGQVLAKQKKEASDLANTIDSLKRLSPPEDLKQFHDTFLSDLQAMNSSLKAITHDIETGNAAGLRISTGKYGAAIEGLFSVTSENNFAKLHTDSTIKTQYQTLKSDNPLP